MAAVAFEASPARRSARGARPIQADRPIRRNALRLDVYADRPAGMRRRDHALRKFMLRRPSGFARSIRSRCRGLVRSPPKDRRAAGRSASKLGLLPNTRARMRAVAAVTLTSSGGWRSDHRYHWRFGRDRQPGSSAQRLPSKAKTPWRRTVQASVSTATGSAPSHSRKGKQTSISRPRKASTQRPSGRFATACQSGLASRLAG